MSDTATEITISIIQKCSEQDADKLVEIACSAYSSIKMAAYEAQIKIRDKE